MADVNLNSNGFLIGLPAAQYNGAAGVAIDQTAKTVSFSATTLNDTQLDALKRKLGIDRTELWRGTFTPTGGTTYTMSEPITNFERLEIVAYGTDAGVDVRYYFPEFLSTNPYFMVYTVSNWGSGDYALVNATKLQWTSSTVLTYHYSTFFGKNSGTSVTSWTCSTGLHRAVDIMPVRITGIRRISNG